MAAPSISGASVSGVAYPCNINGQVTIGGSNLTGPTFGTAITDPTNAIQWASLSAAAGSTDTLLILNGTPGLTSLPANTVGGTVISAFNVEDLHDQTINIQVKTRGGLSNTFNVSRVTYST